MLGALVSFLTATFFTSPDVTVFPQVQLLAGRSAVVVNAAFALAIIVAGAIGMTHGTFQIRYEVKDLIPRLVFAFVISNFGVELCRLLIETVNALTAAMVGETASGPQVITFVKVRLVSALTSPAAALLAVVIGLIIVVLFYMLLVGWFARIAALIVLAGIAPIALVCYCLPQTQAVAQLWWRALLGCLATPLLQAVFFSTGVDLLLDPRYNALILMGLPWGTSTDVFNLVVAACLLGITVRIPKLVSRYVTRSGTQMSTTGVVLRAVVIQSITRRLRIPGLGRR
ncbi:conjugal transfer protein TrbL family protein [Mycobacterium sp.]|uniref:conjugal transfer protein TrbL family protein n=1 Tax=Mycobacterium sp. TaxID=1785 RepID=UPI0028BD2B7C|nr:conjugal transfer protein TrbL family protein [Mycobacterium sp.]